MRTRNLILAGATLLAATNASFASTVHVGTLTPFTGGDAGEGLDLGGNIVHAFNLGGATRTVQGVTFVGASVGAPPAGIAPAGGTLEFNYSNANPGGANGTDYGPSSDDDALESIVNTVWYNSNWTFDLEVVPGTAYRLQLILQESYFPLQIVADRNFDLSVETASPDTLSLAVEELVLGQETNGANSGGADAGLVYIYTFTATDSSFRVALDDSPTGADTNAILAAVLLEELGDDTTPPGIATLDPAAGATGVPTNSDLVVNFNEAVVFDTGNITIRESVGDAVVEAFDVATSPNLLLSGARVTIDPGGELASSTGYYVEIDAGAFQDLAGNSFAGISGSGTWNFTTAAPPSGLGALTPFTGGDAGEGLDLSGNMIYAFNLGGTVQTVQGVDFAAASVGAPPAGIAPAQGTLEFNYSAANPGGAKGADYGASPDDDALEEIAKHSLYNANWSFDLEVVPGTQYQLQLIFQESWFPAQGDPRRNFDVSVETASPSTLTLVLDDFAHGQETNGANQPGDDFGVVYIYTFTATDDSFRVALDDNPLETGDGNAVLAGVTLEEVSEESLALRVTGNGANLDFEWESQPGMFYVLWSSTDLEADLAIWDSVNVPGSMENNGIFEIATNALVNMHSIPRLGDPTRFYRVQEFPLPPVTVLSDDFESGLGGWTVGSDGDAGTEWQLGTPTNIGPAAANSGVSCFGTNLSNNYEINADVWLRSPPVDLTGATAATLTFAEFKDIEEGFDFGAIRVLDAADDSELAVIEEGIDGVGADWRSVTKAIPAQALGTTIKIEFRLVSDDIGNFAGWYIDDVAVTTPDP